MMYSSLEPLTKTTTTTTTTMSTSRGSKADHPTTGSATNTPVVFYQHQGLGVTWPKSESSDQSSELDTVNRDDHHHDEHKTTVGQTLIHLIKGNVGAGCLSLPWAVSQLGLWPGVLAIFLVAYWTSYNCMTLVKLKRYMADTTNQHLRQQPPPTTTLPSSPPPATGLAPASERDAGDTESHVSSAATHITYPDVGEFLYGVTFQQYVTACICIQQLAICTVFFSFVGENLLAVLEQFPDQIPSWMDHHSFVTTVTLPICLALSFIPTLKHMSPLMAVGTLLLFIGFTVLGGLIATVWSQRPPHTPRTDPAHIPSALCALLYAYEGICLVLPIESAMKEARHFAPVFWFSTVVIASIMATVAILCVLAFGKVTNGSVTAYLVQTYHDDETMIAWLMIANTAVSLSVILTYPLQLFPAVELIGPWLQQNVVWQRVEQQEEGEERLRADLSAFEPLPPLPEADSVEHPVQDQWYECELYQETETTGDHALEEDDTSRSVFSAITAVVVPKFTNPGDSLMLRVLLVLLTYLVAVVVPNVQALISLAGALAGSSTALLIPPLLELAWIQHLESGTPTTLTTSSSGAPMVAIMPNTTPTVSGAAMEASGRPAATVMTYYRPWIKKARPAQERTPLEWIPSASALFQGKWWLPKLKNYLLLIMGVVFLVIGTGASVADIVRIYQSH